MSLGPSLDLFRDRREGRGGEGRGGEGRGGGRRGGRGEVCVHVLDYKMSVD